MQKNDEWIHVFGIWTLSVPKTETEQHIFNQLLRENVGLDFTKSRHRPCAHAAKEASMQSCFDMVRVS